MDDRPDPQPERSIDLFGRKFTLPKSRRLRICLGVLLVVGGILGFLPILGFWMVPLGLLVLSYEFAWVRRGRRRLALWWHAKKRTRRR
jgi:hypothetical protein